MEKHVAISLVHLMDQFQHDHQSNYEIEKMDIGNETVRGFHQWANGKKYLGCYHVLKPEEASYFLLFIDWHRNENYYLVIYAGNKSTTLAELNRVVEVEAGTALVWKYNPLKRDGKNQQRKAYFKQIFGSTSLEIVIPNTIDDIPSFFDQLFGLSRNRLKADRIVDQLDE